MKYPLLLILSLLVAVIAIGDFFMPYGPFRETPDWSADTLTYQGVVTRQPARHGKTVGMVLRMTPGDRLVALTGVGEEVPQPADLIVFHARIVEPHNPGNPGAMDYAAYQRHQGITGTAFCYRNTWRNLGMSSHPTVSEQLLRQRQSWVDSYARYLQGDVLAIVAAMTLGDRSMLTPDLRHLYADTGASHVLALSGLHLTILYFLLSLLTIRLLQRWSWTGRVLGTLLCLFAIWGFVGLTGMPLSLLRAAMMLTLYELLRLVRRNAPPYHTLVLTLILLLLYDPLQLFDVGLQLSALSVAAIIMTARWHGEYRKTRLTPLLRNRMGQRLLDSFVLFLLVSLSAQIATLPLVAHYFGRISLVGILSACWVIPAAYILMTTAMLFLLLPLPLLREGLSVVLSGTLDGLHFIMQHLACLPFASVSVSLSWWGVAGAYAALWVVVSTMLRADDHRLIPVKLRDRRPWFLAVCVMLLTLVAEQAVNLLERPAPHIAIYNRPSQPEIHVVAAGMDSIAQPGSSWWTGHVVMFGDRRVAVMTASLPRHTTETGHDRLPVDALLLCRGARGHIDNYLDYYHPDTIVLDGSLSDFYRARFGKEAESRKLPVYDVKEQGAFLLYTCR